jgi:hypothetical protein
MKRIILKTGWLCLIAAAAFAAHENAEAPYYVAVELSLDGVVRDAGAIGLNDRVGSRSTTAGETHAFVRRGDDEIDLHPAWAASSRAIAGDVDVQVGAAGIGSHSHAVVWQAAARSAVDLHGFLSQRYTDSIATGFDDAGNVTGVAIDSDGTAHDILWRAAKVQVSANSSGGGGSVGGGGGGSTAADKVSITRALWFGNPMAPPTGELLVQATSSRPDAVLTLSDTTTGQFIATLPNLGGGRYGGTVIFRFNPVTSVTVTSNLGGSNLRSVILGVQ